jgi:ParB family chromosome partitioning protein
LTSSHASGVLRTERQIEAARSREGHFLQAPWKDMPPMTTTLTPSHWTNTRFELMDPREILLDKNARTIEDIKRENPDLVDSVGKYGVLQPAIAHPTAAGRVRMHDGHQRALALIEHIDEDVPRGAPEALVMPVIITDLTDEADHAWLREMWIYNEQRKGFSAIEKVGILEQMALDGLSNEEIGTQLGIPADTVRAGRRVHANAMARSALTENRQLSFEQADAFAEFADDPDACDRLNTTLNEDPDTFDHIVSELQQERDTRIARDELIEKLRADNVHILEDHEVASSQRLTDLFQDQARKNRLSDDLDAHKACSGHAARVVQGYFDSEPRVEYWCRRWEIRGHVRSAAAGSGSSGSGARKGKRSAVEKAEHNRVVRNNKKWLAAIPVRRKKLAELLAADELPARVQHHIALATSDGAIEHTPKSKALAYELLGFTTKRGKQVKLATKLRRATADRATMINLAFLIAAFEVTYDLEYAKNTWRRPADNDRIYFQLLEDLWGTKLPRNIAEQLVLDPDADKKDWPHLQAAAAPAAPEPDAADPEDDSQDDSLDSTATDAVYDEHESFAEDLDDAELTDAGLTDDSVAA